MCMYVCVCVCRRGVHYVWCVWGGDVQARVVCANRVCVVLVCVCLVVCVSEGGVHAVFVCSCVCVSCGVCE